MTDFLDTTFLVNYVRTAQPETYKLLNAKQKTMATAYESGERSLAAAEVETKLVDSVTNFYLMSSEPVRLTLTNGTVLENMKQFAYASDEPIGVSVTNTSGQIAKLTYASGLKNKTSNAANFNY